MNDATIWLAVGLGGAMGAVLRGSTYRLLDSFADLGGRFGFAAATLAVNLVGSLLFGVFTSVLTSPSSGGGTREWVGALAMTGFCGSLTTFSTFCAGTLGLHRLAERRRLLLFLLGHAVACPFAVSMGRLLVR